SGDEPGSIEYSAVTQPLPRPRIQRGTSSSTEAVHSTRVRPNDTRHDPRAISVKSRSNVIGRRSVGARPSGRGMAGLSRVEWLGRVGRRVPHLGVVELGAEQPGPELAERLDVAAGQE